MVGTWVLMIYLCKASPVSCSYHLFGPTYPSQQACLADLEKVPKSGLIRQKQCTILEAPGHFIPPS